MVRLVSYITYKDLIKQDMIQVGTYKPQFDKIINNLAKIYDDMDIAREQFERSGGQLIVKHTNKNGSTNLVKNPYYLVIEGLQANILQYSRELGLTPMGLKKINEKEMSGKKKVSKLDSVLESLANG